MRRELVLILAAVAIAVAMPAPAEAQTLVPDIDALIGGDDRKAEDDSTKSDERCGHGVTMICAGETLVGGVGGAAADVVGGAVGAAGDAVLGGVVDWASAGAAWLVTEIGQEIDKSTRPAIGSSWFGSQYAAVRELAISLSIVFLLAAIAHSVIRQDMRMLSYSVLVALPMSLLLTFAAVVLVEMALAITDWMTAQALASFGRDAGRGFRGLAEFLEPTAATGNPLPGFVMFLAAALTAALALVVWIELVLREASIYVAVTFLPISFVAMIWRPTSGWAVRLTEWLGAIVLAKFTIAVAFAVAGSALTHASHEDGGLSTLLAGCAVLLVAALTPWVLLRMLPGSVGAANAMHRGVVRQAAGSAIGTATATMITRQAILRAFSSPAPIAKGAAARPVGSTRPPSPPRTEEGPRLHPPPRRQPTSNVGDRVGR